MEISRKKLLEAAIYNVIQEAIRKKKYSNIKKTLSFRKHLQKVSLGIEEKNFIVKLNQTDKDVIESILSDITRLLNI